MCMARHTPTTVTPGPNDLRCDVSEYYRRDFSSDGALPETLSCGAVNPGNHGPGLGVGPYFAPHCLGGSDYSGSLVEVSNHRVFCATFKAGQGVWWSDLHGGYSTFGVLVDPARIPSDIVTEVAEWLAALDSHCVADEDDLSELEIEAQGEAWESWARWDFIKALESTYDCDLDAVSADAVFELFRTAEDAANVYWENQSGSEMYIDVDRIANEVTEEEVKALPGYIANDA